MRIVVCVRGVARNPTGLALGRGSATAVSFGLSLRDELPVDVWALSVAPHAEALLRGVGALGAQAGVHVVATPHTTTGIARAIARAVSEVGFDVVLMGPGSCLAAMVAELLDVPLLDDSATLTLSGSEALAQRRTPGATELVAGRLPCVVSVAVDAAAARHPDLWGILASRTMPLRRLSAAQLLLPAEPDIMVAPAVAAQREVEGAEDGALALVDLLAREGVLR